jgi:ubiquinol-cytochrome c reductase cytochrome b subunit
VAKAAFLPPLLPHPTPREKTSRGKPASFFSYKQKAFSFLFWGLKTPDDCLTTKIKLFLEFKNFFYTSRKPAISRQGPHTFLFKQILVGFLLGDGWLEKHGQGARLGISCIDKFKDVAQWYKTLLYGLGYTNGPELGEPLVRNNRPTAKPYYQLRTFSFASLIPFYNSWYVFNNKVNKVTKVLPSNIQEYFTPLVLAIWVMGDGCGLKDGGFKLCSHSFSKEENMVLLNLLTDRYGLKVSLQNEGTKGQTYLRIWKRSMPLLKTLVYPYLCESCYYKFKFV